MKRSDPAPAFDRLRELFRPPESFGTAYAPAPHGPPAASLRASPRHPSRSDLSRSDPGRSDPGRSGLGRSGLGRSDPGQSDPGRSGLGQSGLSQSGLGRPDADHRDAEVFEREGFAAERLDHRGAARGLISTGRFDPGLPGIRVLATVAAVAALLAGVYLWWSRPDPQPAPQPVLRSAARPASAATAVGPALPATPSPAQTTVVVDVAGKVRHPGVVSLPSGSRVIDAIKAAGGLRPGADTGPLNLARRVVDGEQIPVGVEVTPAPVPAGAPPGPAATAAPGTPVDLNAATAAQLDQLPGVGPVLAQRIVDYRTQHGAFRSVDELRQVSGIGEAKFGDLKSLVRV